MLIVDVFVMIGIEVDMLCGEGVCGICMVLVFDGEFDYCDYCLSKVECVSNMVICCCVLCVCFVVLVFDF